MEKPTAPIGFFFLGLFKLVFKRAENQRWLRWFMLVFRRAENQIYATVVAPQTAPQTAPVFSRLNMGPLGGEGKA
jgi:hypothetical protein